MQLIIEYKILLSIPQANYILYGPLEIDIISLPVWADNDKSNEPAKENINKGIIEIGETPQVNILENSFLIILKQKHIEKFINKEKVLFEVDGIMGKDDKFYPCKHIIHILEKNG